MKNLLMNIILVLAIAGIAAVLIFRFVIPGSGEPRLSHLRLDAPGKITISDMNGNKTTLLEIMPEKTTFYLMICDMDDCFSCIYKGVGDTKRLSDAGHENAVIVVADKLEDVRGWSTINFPTYSNFYMLDTASFYDHIHTARTPIIAKFERGKVISFRLIEP